MLLPHPTRLIVLPYYRAGLVSALGQKRTLTLRRHFGRGEFGEAAQRAGCKTGKSTSCQHGRLLLPCPDRQRPDLRRRIVCLSISRARRRVLPRLRPEFKVVDANEISAWIKSGHCRKAG